MSAGGGGGVDVGVGVAGEGDDVVAAVAVDVADAGLFGADGEEVVPFLGWAEGGAGGEGDDDVGGGGGALGEGDDVVASVAVDVAEGGVFAGDGEVVVPFDGGAGERCAGGEGDVDVGVGVVGEGDDVVFAVAVDVADGGDFVVGGEPVVPFGAGVEAGAGGGGDVDVGEGAVGEGDDVVAVVAVEVSGEECFAVEAEEVVPFVGGAGEGGAGGGGDVDVVEVAWVKVTMSSRPSPVKSVGEPAR